MDQLSDLKYIILLNACINKMHCSLYFVSPNFFSVSFFAVTVISFKKSEVGFS